MAKIMLVGLGGTGSKIVVEVEKLIGRLPAETRNDITLATLGIDTHDQYLSEIRDPVSSLQMNTDVGTLIKNIDQFPYISEFWNPQVRPRDTSNGAGGVRMLSRVSVFRHADKIYERVGASLDKLAAIKGGGNIYVFVVGSLYGGTGSGAFIDVANIISNKLQENLALTDFRIIGHFFLPSILPSHTDRNHENAYASLMEYEHILKSQGYKACYNRSMAEFKVDLPYHNLFLISGFTHNNLSLPHKPEDFYHMVAHKIYFEIISQTLFREFMGKLIDVHVLAEAYEYAGGIKKPTAVSAFGMSAVSYPFDNIRRYIAHRIASGVMNSGFLAPCSREAVENEDLAQFMNNTLLDRLDRKIQQDKNVAFDAEELRFDKSRYDTSSGSLERISDNLSADYDAMKNQKFDRFYATIRKKIEEIKKEYKTIFLNQIQQITKTGGIVKAQTFIELLMDTLTRLEKKYHENYRKFERVSDEAALDVVAKELDDVKINVRTWWPVFKRKKVAREVDEFIDEANRFVDDNMNEIINEHAAMLTADFREFLRKYYTPGGREGAPTGFLERIRLEAESLRRDLENVYREVAGYIQLEKGKPNEYRVVQNLLTLEQLDALYKKSDMKMNELYTLFTNGYLPHIFIDPHRLNELTDEQFVQELDRFPIDRAMKEFSDKITAFTYGIFDQQMDLFRPENVIKTLDEDEIVNRIDDLIRYCSPFLGYRKDAANIKRVENTMILIRRAAYEKVKNRIKDKYGANCFFIETDDVDFMMIMKYVHGYDFNSLTEIDSLARKYTALAPEERDKRHLDVRLLGRMEPIRLSDINIISDDTYKFFACGLNFKIGRDFDIDFGPGRGKINPRFEGKNIIDRTETGINFKFLDWEGREKEEQELGYTLMEAFETFTGNPQLALSIGRYEKEFINRNFKGHKQCLEDIWKQLDLAIVKLKDSSRETKAQETDLYRNMLKAVDKELALLA